MVVGLAVALSILYILHTQLIHVNEMKCHSMLNGIPCCAVLYCFTSCSGIVIMGCGMCGVNDAFKKGGRGGRGIIIVSLKLASQWSLDTKGFCVRMGILKE